MNINQFDFHLPTELIATRPARPRSASRLLFCNGDIFEDLDVKDLPFLLGKGDLLIFNDTKVLPAHLNAIRKRDASTAKISLTLTEVHQDGTWSALVKPLRKIKMGETLYIAKDFTAHVTEKTAQTARLCFNCHDNDLGQALDRYGQMPLPPYIARKRALDKQDIHDYQTIFAQKQGAVAAPTAALHFDNQLRFACLNNGVEMAPITLHVGAGTFLPIKMNDISNHKMHAEWGEISQKTAEKINKAHRQGGRVIAIGTTALRVLETAANHKGQLTQWAGKTDIFIKPGYRFKSIDMLMTNFHLPKSTLIILIAAFCGIERTQKLYEHAIKNRYRFYSYGDSSLLTGTQPIAKISNYT